MILWFLTPLPRKKKGLLSQQPGIRSSAMSMSKSDSEPSAPAMASAAMAQDAAARCLGRPILDGLWWSDCWWDLHIATRKTTWHDIIGLSFQSMIAAYRTASVPTASTATINTMASQESKHSSKRLEQCSQALWHCPGRWIGILTRAYCNYYTYYLVVCRPLFHPHFENEPEAVSNGEARWDLGCDTIQAKNVHSIS